MSDNSINEVPSGIIGDNNQDEDENEDEWGTHELIIDRFSSSPVSGNESQNRNKCTKQGNGDDEEVNDLDTFFQSDEYWNDDEKLNEGTKNEVDITKGEENQNSSKDNDSGVPMFLLDVTRINPDVHSKYDRNSVNNPEEASKMRRKFERDLYQKKTKNVELIAHGTIIPCSTSVWRAALCRMRNERQGHYFVPIFPPS